MWFQRFLNDLNARRYPYTQIDGRQAYIMPNAREIHFMDITLPEQCIPYLMEDLSPTVQAKVDPPSPLKVKAHYIAKALRFLFRLKPITGTFEPSGQVQNRWLNILPVGWKEDARWTSGGAPIILPKGGELV